MGTGLGLRASGLGQTGASWVVLVVALAACGKREAAPPPPVEPPAHPVAVDGGPKTEDAPPLTAPPAPLPPAVRALVESTDEAWPEALIAWHQSGSDFTLACSEDKREGSLAPLLQREQALLDKLDPARLDDPHLAALLHLGDSLRRSTSTLGMGVGLGIAVKVARWGHDHGVKVPQLATYPIADDFPIAVARIDVACLHDRAATALAADLGMADDDALRKGRRELGLEGDVTFESDREMFLAFLRESQAQLANVRTVEDMQRVLEARKALALAHPRSVFVRILGRSAGFAGVHTASGLAEYRDLAK
jgi:hypothetical protein